MARNNKTHEKRIKQIKGELQVGWSPSNPKLATARWHLVQELAELEGVKVQEIKRRLKKGEL